MAERMLEKEIEVYSEKYDVHGIIKDYGVVTKLFFAYEGREIVMGLHRNILKDEKYEDLGRDIIESYISNLASQEENKLQLHYWYIDQYNRGEETFIIGHGIVTGHAKLQDSIKMHTSAVQGIHIDEEENELILTTMNSIYHCPLAYCRFDKQDKYPDLISDYERLKKKYKDSIKYPSIGSGKVLLVLADFCEYYFHSLYYVPADSADGKHLEYSGWAHIGTFQDSYLVSTEDARIDLRYFPHYQNIDFYGCDTDGCPLYLENIGGSTIYAKTHAGLIKIELGERKKVVEENAEVDTPVLPAGDLYPAGIIE